MCTLLFSPTMVDTLVEFKEWRKRNNRIKVADHATGQMVTAKNNLGVLAKYAGYSLDKAHDAKADCRACVAGLKWMRSGLPPQAGEAEEASE
jgi:DNA polymerase III epsilon subunit-like protein